jgi:LAS superfamily LD-carboxypeptidase LdcB
MVSRRLNYRRVVFLTAFAALITLGGGASAYGALVYHELVERVRSLEERSVILEETALAERRLNEELQRMNGELAESLRLEKEWSGFIGTQFKVLSGTVGALTKLSQTDRELLAKYSKVYFLNENYVPESLSGLDKELLLNPANSHQIHSRVEPFADEMIRAAKSAGLDLRIVSAYRSFDDQAAVKSGYKVLYGSGANRFSADQGYSEHQLGTALDLATPKFPNLSASFETAPEYKWLTENAHLYGFILSYPKGNYFYQYEPWHWRFVGKALANDLREKGIRFYDMPQREIDAYLANIFD